MAPFGYRDTFGDAGLGGISAVVTAGGNAIPPGYQLGEVRQEGGIVYQLVYNAGNSVIGPGFVATSRQVGGGAYSVTVSTAADVNAHIGAVVAHHATVPTDCFFWGAKQGFLASGLVATSITQLLGNASRISTDGCVLPVTSTAASCIVASGNMAIAYTVVSPSAGTVAVRQAGVVLNIPLS